MNGRCQALYSDGRQCKRLSVGKFSYSGDPEMAYRHHDYRDVSWVLVELCLVHAKSNSMEDHPLTHGEKMKKYKEERNEAMRKNSGKKR